MSKNTDESVELETLLVIRSTQGNKLLCINSSLPMCTPRWRCGPTKLSPLQASSLLFKTISIPLSGTSQSILV